MVEDVKELLRGYLSSTMLAERTLEEQLPGFVSASSDDEEVQSLFSRVASDAHAHREALAHRLEEIGGEPAFHFDASAFDELTSPLASSGRGVEEQLLHHLLISYTLQAGASASNEILAAMADAAGDEPTGILARQIQEDGRIATQRIMHVIPSRSKIAFNMLTVDEVDPAIETKLADDRVVES